MSKRILLLLMIGLITAASFPLSAVAQETTTLSISCICSDNFMLWLSSVLPEFEAQNPDITVEVIDYDFTDEEYREQIALDFSLGEGTDLASFDGFWVPEFVSAGLIKPMNQVAGPQVDEWEGWDHIPSGIQEILSYEGERYGIAAGTDVRLIYYRTDLFEQAGIEVPWQPTSWDDILAAADQLKTSGVETPLQIDGGTYMGEATTMQGYFMLLLGAGSHMYDFEQNKWIVSSPHILETLNLYAQIYQQDQLGNPDFQLTETGRNDSFTAFKEGRIGIYVEGDFLWRSVTAPNNVDYGIPNRDEVVAWALMPAIEPGAGYRGQDFVTISGGTGWVINPNTPNPDAAWKLLSFLSSRESAEARLVIETRISFRDDVAIDADPVLKAMADSALPLTTVRPLLPEYPLISYEAQLMTERVISGEMTPEEAMAAYAEAVTAIVGEENTLVIPVGE